MAEASTLEAVEKRRAYQRKWRREHPERVRAYQLRYWLKKSLGANEKVEGVKDER